MNPVGPSGGLRKVPVLLNPFPTHNPKARGPQKIEATPQPVLIPSYLLLVSFHTLILQYMYQMSNAGTPPPLHPPLHPPIEFDGTLGLSSYN